MKRFITFYLLISTATFLGGFLYGTTAFAANETTMATIEVVEQSLHRLTWQPPDTRENGDSLAPEEIVGYRIDRLDGNYEDDGSGEEAPVLESIELGPEVLELAITIVPDQCMIYKAYAIATDGSPPTDQPSGTLVSEPADAIRICVIPPSPPRDFRVQ